MQEVAHVNGGEENSSGSTRKETMQPITVADGDLLGLAKGLVY